MYQELETQKTRYIPIEKSGIDRYEKVLTFANTLPVFLKENESIESALYKIIQSHHRSIPIVSKKHQLAGIVAAPDLLNAFLHNRNFNNHVSTLMTREVISVNHDDPLGLVVQKMKMSRRGRMPVLKKGRLVGMIGEYDITKYFAHVNLGIQISEIMTRKPLFINPNISIFDAVKILANTKYRRLPVVESGKLVGIVTASDMLKYLRNSYFKMAELLQPLGVLVGKKVISVEKHKDTSEAIRSMLVNDVSGILVVDNDKLEGIVTQRDIINQLI
jgi:predicted transcriptional regulator